MNEYIMALWQRPPRWGTKSWDPRCRTRSHDRCGQASSRRLAPLVALLENRTLLSSATLTSVSISASSLVYGQSEVLTATVTTSPPSGTTPTGGTVSFMDGSATLVVESLTNGKADFTTTSLGVGSHSLTAIYSGDSGFGSSSTVAASSVIKTIAGGSTANGGQAIQTSLYAPAAVALDAAGDIFIADSTDDVIREVNTHGVITTVAGNGTAGYSGDGGQATAAELNKPTGIAVDAGGDIFIADSLNNVIREVSGGVISTVAGNGTAGYSGDSGQATAAELNDPTNVATGSTGNVYIADTDNDVIREVIVGTGVITTVAGDGHAGDSGNNGPATAATMEGPTGVAVGPNGQIYIADTGNNTIREVSGGLIATIAGDGSQGYSGDLAAATAAELNGPIGIALDSAGDLDIADTGNNVIRCISAGVITTVVGNGTSGYSGDGGHAGGAALNGPGGVALDSAGDIFIADTLNSVIREVSGDTINTVAGNGFQSYSGDGGPATAAQLDQPADIALNAAGDIFIADSLNSAIREIDTATGVITAVAGNGVIGYSGDTGQATASELYFAQGIAFDSSGDLFIADSNNCVIREINASTRDITTVAGNGSIGYTGDDGQATEATLFDPLGVAVNSAGEIFIADSLNNVIREVNTQGVITTVAGNGTPGYSGDNGQATAAELDFPTGLAVDSAGNLYIADSNNNVIREVSNGVITTVAGNGTASYSGDSGQATAAEMDFPTGVALDSSGNLYIADGDDNVIREVSGGVITTVAGNGIGGYSGDGGLPTAAELFDPTGIAVDSSGNLYIADNENNLIREVSSVTLGAPTVTVTPAPLTVTANYASMFYGAAVPTLAYQITGFVNGQNSSIVTGAPTISTAASATSTVAGGPYTITITAGSLSAANYTFATFQNASLTVNPAPLTLTANNASMLYGAAVPALSDQITGFVNGQNSSVVTGTASISTTASSSSTVAGGPYPITITASTFSAPNYSFTNLINGLLTVTPAPLTVTANNASMVYGGAVPAFSDQITGFANGQNASVVIGAATISTTASSTSTVAGGPYPITITAGSLSAANYTFATFQSGSLTVTLAPLTVTANNASMVYGAPVPMLSVQITGFVNGQNSSVVTGTATISTSASSTSTVAGGPYPITITASTFSAPNYSFTNLINGLLTVTPAPLTVTANNASMVYGGAVPAFSDQITGFANGQNASVVVGKPNITTTATSASHVADGPYPIRIAAGSLSALNYMFTTFNNGSLTVTPATLTVTANSATKLYGAALPVLTDLITGFLNGDTTAVVSGTASLTTTATVSSTTGVYTINAGAGTLSAADYQFPAAGVIGSSLRVMPAPLTITATSLTLDPGQAIPSLTINYSGFVNGDTAASLTTPPTISTSVTSASPAGSYPIIVSGAGSSNYTIRFVNGTLTVIPTPATVQAVSIQKVRVSKHKMLQVIVLQFSESLNSIDAQMINAYAIVTVPPKKKQRSRSVPISRATYSSQALTVTLTTRKTLVLNPPLKLTISAAALLDALNRPLDGNDSGLPGANYVVTIRKSGVTVNS